MSRSRKSAVISLVLSACVLPLAALSLQRSVAAMVDSLAAELLGGEPSLSRAGVLVLPISDASPLARECEVGASVRALVEKALLRSVAFKPLDRSSVERRLEELERELADPSARAEIPERLIEEAEYLIAGAVTEEGDLFRVQLRLVRTDTTAVAALADSTFPVSELVAFGRALFKPFGLVGPFVSAACDLETAKGPAFGAVIGSAGVLALFPLRTVYLLAGAEALYAEGDQASAALGKEYGLPAGAAGTNKIAALGAFGGIGVFFPIAYRVYGHLDFNVGLGADKRRALYVESGDGTLGETSFDGIEPSLRFGAAAGVAWKLSDALALDFRIGVVGRQFGFMQGYPNSQLYLPASLVLAAPF